MTSKTKTELARVIHGFKPKIERADDLIEALIATENVSFSMATTREYGNASFHKFMFQAFRPDQVKREVAKMVKHLEKIELSFRELKRNSFILQDDYDPINIDRILLRDMRHARPSFGPDKSPDSEGHWFMELTATMKYYLTAEQTAHTFHQNTPKNVNAFKLTHIGAICQRFDIKISSSKTSRFYKIAQCMIGIQNPEALIKLIMPRLNPRGK